MYDAIKLVLLLFNKYCSSLNKLWMTQSKAFKATIHFYWERRQISCVVNLKVAFRKEPKDFFGGTESIIISSDAVYYVFCR
jgi:hypothetical protein